MQNRQAMCFELSAFPQAATNHFSYKHASTQPNSHTGTIAEFYNFGIVFQNITAVPFYFTSLMQCYFNTNPICALTYSSTTLIHPVARSDQLPALSSEKSSETQEVMKVMPPKVGCLSRR